MPIQRLYINAAGEAWYGVRKRGLTSASWMEVDPAAMVNGFASGQILMQDHGRLFSGEIALYLFLVLLVIVVMVI